MVTNFISEKAKIGNNVKIWHFTYVGDNTVIGDNVKIGSLVHIDYNVKIGENYEIAIASLSLVFVSLAFYKYHKFPSKIFPGDSGALTLGAMYGAIAIVGEVEVIAAIALGPAIINSFLFLSSMKRIVEHRENKIKTCCTHRRLQVKSNI